MAEHLLGRLISSQRAQGVLSGQIWSHINTVHGNAVWQPLMPAQPDVPHAARNTMKIARA